MSALRLAFVALALLCLGGAKKPPMVDIRIHALGNEAEAPTFAIPATLLNGRVDNHGSRLLQQHTMSRRGELLVVLVNGRQVSNLLVDRPIDDGIVSIPRGLSADDIDLLTTVFPVIGQEATPKKRR
jgi:hypothetical protein